MKLLKRALNIWLESGRTQTDSRRLTGINTGTCSRLFTEDRGLALDTRSRLIRAIQECNVPGEGLAAVVADRRDNIPVKAADHIRVSVNDPYELQDKISKQDRVAMANAEFQHHLDIDDPATVELVLRRCD